jgi:anti-anti-sigma factor
LKYSQREVGGAVILDMKGKFQGGPEAEDFRDLFKGLVADGKTNVVLNLKNIEWIASTGIGIMMRAYKTIQEAGGHFVLCHVGERTQQIFNVLRLPDIFEIVETEEEALSRIDKASA